jgi:hypothetical protein
MNAVKNTATHRGIRCRYFCMKVMGGRIMSGLPKTPVRTMRDEEPPAPGGKIDVYSTTTRIPATMGIRHCANREGTSLKTKNRTTVRTERGMPITAKSMSTMKKLLGSKIGTICSRIPGNIYMIFFIDSVS